jgi:hypothetical protein
MPETKQFTGARLIVARVVSEKLPHADRWSVQKNESRIDGLPDNEFKNFRSVSSV